MASELTLVTLYNMAIRTALAEMNVRLNNDPAKQAELTRIYQDLRDEEIAAKVTLRLNRGNINSLKKVPK